MNTPNSDAPEASTTLRGGIEAVHERCDKIEKGLAENTAATKQVQENTAELIEAFSTMKAAFRVLNWIGAAAKPIAAVLAVISGCVAVWASIKEGLFR